MEDAMSASGVDKKARMTEGRLTFPEPLLDVLDKLEDHPVGLLVRELLRISRLGLLGRVGGDKDRPVLLW